MSVFRASNTPDTDWSVPLQRTPYPGRRAADPDCPTERLYVPEDEPEPLAEPDEPPPDDEPEEYWARRVLIALVLAALALLISGTSGVISWYALGRADRAAGSVTAMHSMPLRLPTPTPTSTPAPVAQPSVLVSVSAASAASSGEALRYAQEPLQVRADCGRAAFVDVDQQGRVGAPEQDGDLRYENHCGTDGALLSVGPGATAGSHVNDGYLDRPGCADAIRARPLDEGEWVPVQKGTVLCVATATSLALVEVTGVGADGSASLRATAWTPMPQASPGG